MTTMCKKFARCAFPGGGREPEEGKARAILRWYRPPQIESLKMVELRGFEPLTPRLPEAPADDKSP